MRVYCSEKMAAPGEKSFCVLEYHTVTVQRAFRAKYAQDPPTDKTVRARYEQFAETECLCKHNSSGLPLTAGELEYRIDMCRVTSGAHIEHL